MFCKGLVEDSVSAYMLELGHSIVVIKNVPSHVCSQCGGVSFSDPVFIQIEKIVDKLRSTATEVAIVNFSDKTA
jgi:YgiT-type zinc finger domain-containing protein